MAERSGGLVGTFKIDDGRKVQLAAWLIKDEASFLVGGHECRMYRRDMARTHDKKVDPKKGGKDNKGPREKKGPHL